MGAQVALVAAVVAHVERIEAAKRLADGLGAPAFVDDGTLGEWTNHALALDWATGQNASHVLVVQDDAVPVRGLLDHATEAARRYPDGAIGCYVGRVRPRERAVRRAVASAERLGAGWLEADTLLWGVAVILPITDIPELLARSSALPYDERVGELYRRRGVPVRYTWPSLVDHADGPSVIEGRREREPGRVAWRVGVPDWRGPVVRIGRA